MSRRLQQKINVKSVLHSINTSYAGLRNSVSALVFMHAQDYFQKVSFQRRKQMGVPAMLREMYLHSTVLHSSCAWLWRFMFKSKMTDKASWNLLFLYHLMCGRAFSDLFTCLIIRKAEVTISCKSNITAFWWKWVISCQLHEFLPPGSLSIPSARSWAFFGGISYQKQGRFLYER